MLKQNYFHKCIQNTQVIKQKKMLKNRLNKYHFTYEELERKTILVSSQWKRSIQNSALYGNIYVV